MLAIAASKKEDLLIPVLPGVKYVVTAQTYHSKYIYISKIKKKLKQLSSTK